MKSCSVIPIDDIFADIEKVTRMTPSLDLV